MLGWVRRLGNGNRPLDVKRKSFQMLAQVLFLFSRVNYWMLQVRVSDYQYNFCVHPFFGEGFNLLWEFFVRRQKFSGAS